MDDWFIFKGEPPSERDEIKRLPPAPRWRQFTPEESVELSWDELRGRKYQADKEEKRMVNAALYLRRPLLITGKPGTGKSSLAYAVAYELKLGKVLKWPITTRSTLQDGLYQYDAIGRLQELQRLRYEKQDDEIKSPDIGQYFRLGPLGTAFLPSNRPRVLLIDEIDKSDIDLPNDLLNIFEEGRFEIPELSRLPEEEVGIFAHDSRVKVGIPRGRVVCREFPLVFLTSNKERELPAPFLRRCLRLGIKKPDRKKLEAIVEAHFGDDKKNASAKDDLITIFDEMREKGNLATDQLLNAIYLVTNGIDLSQKNEDIDSLREAIFRYLSKMSTT